MAELQKVLPADLVALVQLKAAPQASQASYTAASGGVLKLLQSLHKEFSDKLAKVLADEDARSHNFGMKRVDLDDEIKNYNQEFEEKTASAGTNDEQSAAAQAEADAAKAQFDALTKQKGELGEYSKTENDTFGVNQSARAEEIEALGKAIEIISGGEVSGAADKHLPTLVQQGRSFLQLGSSLIQEMNNYQLSNEKAQLFGELSSMLSQKNEMFFGNKSKALSLVAVRMLTDAKGPFDNILVMVKDMIAKLEKEAADEESHNGWCATELKQSAAARKDYTNQVNTARDELEQHKANLAQAEEDIKNRLEEIKQLSEALAEATKIRGEEKAKNEETVAEAQAAQEAVANAKKILEGFYNKQAFVQQSPTVTTPDVQIKAYGGRSKGESQGVIGLLEVIHADFARLEKVTNQAEKAQLAAFEAFSTENENTRTAAQTALDDANVRKATAEAGITDSSASLEKSEELLANANKYYKKLEPACVQEHVSYEERVKMREEEIAALKEALNILESDPRFTH
jgi:hypothetical protein